MGTLNPTHSLTHSLTHQPVFEHVLDTADGDDTCQVYSDDVITAVAADAEQGGMTL